MLTETQKRQFDEEGFVQVPGVLSTEEVEHLREVLGRLFAGDSPYEGDPKFARMDLCAREPETRFLLSHEKVVASLRSILGEDFVFLPEMSAHHAFFSTWHKDTDSQEAAGHDFHWRDDFLMIEAALYLQDNGPHGGGLDVVPGSHREPQRTLVERLRGKLKRRFKSHAIPSKAGDLVLFHFRIDHQATKPKRGARSGGAPSKMAIFLACSSNSPHAAEYRRFLEAREDYVYLRDHRYPPEVEQLAEENQLTLA